MSENYEKAAKYTRVMQQFRTAYSELFAIGLHYGLTFCPFMSTLYDTSLGPTQATLSFHTHTIRLAATSNA